MTSQGAEFDEDRGGPRHEANLISFPEDCDFYKSTLRAWPWRRVEHEGARQAIASVFVESLFRLAPVDERVAVRVKSTVLGRCGV